MNDTKPTHALLGVNEARIALFGTGPEAILKRCWDEWRARGYYPALKIGKRVFVDIEQARAALERRFKVKARPI